MNTMQRREIHPEVRVLDKRRGIVEYTASDETLDSYREVIRASGWRFNHFAKNAPFVDSHNYSTIESLLGKVIHFEVAKKRLVETVQWAVDATASKLAQIGWQMTEGGFLKAVSVGFWPVKSVSSFGADRSGYLKELYALGYTEDNGPRVIYMEQEQVELSACIIGANPNALMNVAKAYKANVLSDGDIEALGRARAKQAVRSEDAGALSRAEFLEQLEMTVRGL